MISKLRLSNPVPFLGGGSLDAGFRPPVTTFGPVPPGYVWTGSIGAVMAQQLTVGSSSAVPPGTNDGNEWLSNIIWTLYRNDQAEATWIGLSQLCDVQAWGNDVLTVVGQVPSAGAYGPLPPAATRPDQQCVISYLGYQGTEDEVPVVVPFVSTSVQSVPWAANGSPQVAPLTAYVLATATGTSTLLLNGPASLWSAAITLSATTGSTLVTADAYIQDALGNVYCVATVEGQGNATTPGNLQVSQVIDLHGVLLSSSEAPITLRVFSTGAPGVRAAAHLVYSGPVQTT